MSIRLKLLAVFLVLAAACLGMALVATYRAAGMVAERRVTGELELTVERVGAELASLQDRYRLAVNELVKSPYMLEALGHGNNIDADLGLAEAGDLHAELAVGNTLMASADLGLLKEGTGRDRNDVIVLLNAEREVIYTVADPDVFGGALEGLEVVDAARRGQGGIDLWSARQVAALPIPLLDEPLGDDDLLFVIATPILKRELVEGVLLTGRRASTVLGAPRMGPRGVHALEDGVPEVVLVSRDGASASRHAGLGEALERAGPTVGTLEVGARRLLVARRPLEILGSQRLGEVLVLKDPETEVRAMLGAFRLAVVPSALGVLVLAGLAAAWLAARLTRPLVELEEAALQVRRGELDARVTPRSQDEVGRLAVAFNEMVAGLQQRDQIKGLFKRYLAPQVVDELLRHPEKAMPGGERRVLSVLFADLVGFTSMSEELEPEALVSLLNRYFEAATGALSQHGATLDKFIGDAIMCFWNAPLEEPAHAARACRTALALVEVVERLAPEFLAQHGARLDVRVGVNTGACIVGNIGSREAQDYTAVGDAVNLASRLEGACKSYRVRTLVSEEVLGLAGPGIHARELDVVRVQGRRLPLRIFELLTEAQAAGPHLEPYARGLAHYRAGNWAEAAALLLPLSGDGPAQVLGARCEAFVHAPPAPGWDGVWSLGK